MKPTISIALITLGLTFPAPVVADEQSIIDRIEAQRIQQADREYRSKLARYEAHRKRWRLFTCPPRETSTFITLDGNLQICQTKEYDWMGWKRDGTIYTTTRQAETYPPSPKGGLDLPQISSLEKISVDCRTLQVKEYLSEREIKSNRLELQAQSDPVVRERYRQLHVASIPDWRLPKKGSETAMVAARCASAL